MVWEDWSPSTSGGHNQNPGSQSCAGGSETLQGALYSGGTMSGALGILLDQLC